MAEQRQSADNRHQAPRDIEDVARAWGELEQLLPALYPGPLRKEWAWRVFKHVLRNAVRRGGRFSSAEDLLEGVGAASRRLGEAASAPWLYPWFVQWSYAVWDEDKYTQPAGGTEVLSGPPDDPPVEDRINPPSPPGGLLVRSLPGEKLLDTIRRGQDQLRALERARKRFRLPRRPGPEAGRDLKAIDWTWRYYFEGEGPTDIAAAWNEGKVGTSRDVASQTRVSPSSVATTISRAAKRLDLPYPLHRFGRL